MNQILNGDCLELMKDIPNGSIDMILCDLPYGTTACKWDTVIPFDELWKQYKRIVKDNGAIVLTAAQPFTSALIMSNVDSMKHHWIWDKVRGTGFQVAKYRPMMRTEDVCVFVNGKGTFVSYNPQMTARDKVKKSKCYGKSDSNPIANNDNVEREYTERYPTNVIQISNASQKDKFHPTQKPTELFEYLIKTYTNERDLVLDNTAGSGTTAIACLNTNRQFIVMEKEQKYYDIILNRVKEWHKNNQTNIFK